jgi:rubrerythrin
MMAALRIDEVLQMAMQAEETGFAESLPDDTVLPCRDECRRLAAEGNLGKIIDRAVEMEKDAADLYRRLLPGVDNAQALRLIIEEEERHLQQLNTLQREIGGAPQA